MNILVFLSADSKDGDHFLESWRYMCAAGLVHITTIHVASRNLDMWKNIHTAMPRSEEAAAWTYAVYNAVREVPYGKV